MSMPTKDRLAAELRKVAETASQDKAAVYRALADRAETGEFDDYADVHVCGPTALYNELMAAGLQRFARRVAEGEFDATFEESEAWARAQTDPETVRIMASLGLGPDRSRDN